ncbi:MAG: hypothetical protein HUJ74_01945 [Lachnospiraceae bacterium]|nr:hypothetical protein [Lachnospiraceae bacterium]
MGAKNGFIGIQEEGEEAFGQFPGGSEDRKRVLWMIVFFNSMHFLK